MVLLLAIEQEELGTLKLDVPVIVGPAAIREPREAKDGQLLLRADRAYALRELVKAVAVGGSDEAALAICEVIAGSVAMCADQMNARAERLGMTSTHFSSASGAKNTETMSALSNPQDIARLAQALVGHQTLIEWTSLSGAPFDSGTTLLRNPNRLVGSVPGIDGLHAGATRDPLGHPASHHLVATETRGGMRLIAVVLDAPDPISRYAVAKEMLDWGFAGYERVEIVREGERLNMPVQISGGTVDSIQPITAKGWSLIRPRGEERHVELHYQVPSEVVAPLERHQVIGEVVLEDGGEVLAVLPLLSPFNVGVSGILSAAR